MRNILFTEGPGTALTLGQSGTAVGKQRQRLERERDVDPNMTVWDSCVLPASRPALDVTRYLSTANPEGVLSLLVR